MSVPAASLSQRMKEYFDSDALSTDNADYTILIGFQKEVAGLEARAQALDDIQTLADKLCNSQSDPYDDAYSDSTPYLTMRRQIGRELKKILRGVGVVGEATRT